MTAKLHSAQIRDFDHGRHRVSIEALKASGVGLRLRQRGLATRTPSLHRHCAGVAAPSDVAVGAAWRQVLVAISQSAPRAVHTGALANNRGIIAPGGIPSRAAQARPMARRRVG